ncbi:right-handed parallel beta-helix repeat-containing protein [Opitutales bacterium]|nr:right-handed parallel beta-helix repeat-containing protein [Opitutales bacterium]
MEFIRIFILFSTFTFITISSSAKTIFVDDNAPAGGDGASWASAHKYLQDALAGAEYGDEIWVAEGTYKPDQGAGKTAGDRTASFNLVNGVGLYGGFLGRESDRDPQGDNNQTILSGEIDSNSSLWSLHVVGGENLDTGTTLAGFRITKGNANGASGTGHDYGGGMWLKECSLKLSNLVFTHNSASGDGGGIYSDSSSALTLSNCVFTNNSASYGGGIYSSYSSSALTLSNCVFTNNSARHDGGGIYSSSYYSSSSLTLSNCVFTNNSASYGGGIYSSYSNLSVTLTNCLLWKNYSNGIVGHGLISTEPELWHSHILEFGVKATYPGDPNAREFLYQPNINILQGWEGDVRAFNSDPLFVNIDNPIGPDGIWFTDDDGLRVQTDSPAIDAGYNDSLPPDTNDLDKDGNTTEPIPYDALGKTRRIGANVDIGAYEFGDGNSLSQKRFLLSVSAGNGGLVNGVGYFEEGVVANISATASTGYIFSNWSGDASGSSNPLSISMDADKSITANFSQDLSDTDGDGLSNYAELVTHRTDPNSLDTDKDGLTDKQEIDRGWNPNSSDKSVIDAVTEMKGLDSNTTPYSEGWFYLPNQGWLWTNRTSYPYFYDSASKAWMYFQSGNEKPKFYHYGTKEWMTVE